MAHQIFIAPPKILISSDLSKQVKEETVNGYQLRQGPLNDSWTDSENKKYWCYYLLESGGCITNEAFNTVMSSENVYVRIRQAKIPNAGKKNEVLRNHWSDFSFSYNNSKKCVEIKFIGQFTGDDMVALLGTNNENDYEKNKKYTQQCAEKCLELAGYVFLDCLQDTMEKKDVLKETEPLRQMGALPKGMNPPYTFKFQHEHRAGGSSLNLLINYDQIASDREFITKTLKKMFGRLKSTFSIKFVDI